MGKTSVPIHPGADEAAQSLRRDKSVFFFGSGVSVTVEPSMAHRLFVLLQSQAQKLGIDLPEVTAPLEAPVPAPPSPLRDFRDTVAFRTLLRSVKKKEEYRLLIGGDVPAEAGMPRVQALREKLINEAIELGLPVHPKVTLPELATMLERSLGRSELVSMLQSAFDDVLQERPWERGAYPWIPRLPSSLSREIFTTNWCDTLKRAFEAAGRQVLESRYFSDLRLSQGRPHIIKLNRDFVDERGPLITESDYVIIALRF